MTQPRLLAVDLDGTLLDRHGAPHAADLRALRAALAAGVRVCIVTGRLFSGTREVASLLSLTGPVCCADGSHIVALPGGTTLVHHGITGRDAATLREGIARARAATFVFAGDRIVHDARGEAYLDYVRAWSPAVHRADSVVDHASWEHDDGVTAVVAVGEEAGIAEAVHAIRTGLAQAAQVLHFPVGRSGLWGLIARSSRSSKGAALEYVAGQLGVSTAEVVAVGDWLNDVSMFEVAGRSFAMGHAPDEVKRAASDVMPETRETGGGVARALAEAFGVLAGDR